MLDPIIHKFKYGQHTVILDIGTIARQANAAVMVSMSDTTVLVTVVSSNQVRLEQDFFPLVVNYQERTYAAGKFPGGFFRREGRPSENETLTSRLIDRPIRPLFPKGFINDVQVVATVVSVNPQVNPDIVAIIGVSAALSLSDIPFFGPIGAARVGYIKNQYVLNPTTTELSNSKLDLVISGTESNILMVESESCLLSEKEILDAIIFGHEQQQIVIHNINKLVKKVGKTKYSWNEKEVNISLKTYLSELYESRAQDIYCFFDKKERHAQVDSIKKDIVKTVLNSYQHAAVDEKEIMYLLNYLEAQSIRYRILTNKLRIDGRSQDTIRKIDIKTGILPRTHGSALFTRGDTQALVAVTLGTERDAQNIDGLTGIRVDRFLLHYNFPPYCVGEIGVIGAPKRREIGHGRLAKRGMLAVMPNANEFPYTIRVVSEITESNGSSSMASICGTSLALMDAGVPIKAAVAGVAMGLIKEGNDFVVLSDIVSDEDHIGDMDFKVSGSRQGITALQMDIKTDGITYDIINIALKKAKNARLQILDVMEQIIKFPNQEISKFAPRIYSIKVNPDKIKDVIGKGGSVIRSLTEETNTIIDIEDNGIIKIVALDYDKAKQAIRRINDITANVEIGAVYTGKVSHIVEFGAFVTILSGKEGLVHISQISERRINKVTDYLKLGQKVLVKVLEIDRQGRIRLSMKGVHQVSA
ncbi:polynucleotide phosphorylase [Candidatus Blochmanniella pennsylvanica str. BPEN]|uniref:Polyribonucleotide nucleotidyltransferase n=1 Tax=Blochmanniella pennsylvanica (strain BPEN) TaxID=291272 RepID=PNP_BLOPB|nr:polyribonucleotide nucleotidyltransferase [Candidatus Blochmannia pennsylvanicus]Q493T3.1 RecName: Full=Polyribonucleotide nucleotidyltransferase; AltName: Full=Polynucleotide phosphorylase; Short=PNPase [Candidatus Blochmannia pennsylvanicus str. BPEN]AAZ40752.1 polynucleotide phosphorylase [Candidatus Blochmannia pennsylvanicus str. BPEN]UOY04534.1 polyribonucleotide nucleotidyltransferase [Candidatus Blochmannia pennsylvanicus]